MLEFLNRYKELINDRDIIDSDNGNSIKFDSGLGIVQAKIDLS